MKTASAKAKGRGLQKKLKLMLLEAFPSLDEDDVRVTSMGASGEDVQLSPAARLLIPHQIECKKFARFSVYKFVDQAKEHGPHEPLVVIEANRRKPLALVDLDFYIQLLVLRAMMKVDSRRDSPRTKRVMLRKKKK